MANAKKCDRCEKLYEYYSGIELMDGGNCYNWLRLFTTHGSSYKTYDLCPDCMLKLVGFLNNESIKYNLGCEDCANIEKRPSEEPCKNCMHNYVNYWRAKDE